MDGRVSSAYSIPGPDSDYKASSHILHNPLGIMQPSFPSHTVNRLNTTIRIFHAFSISGFLLL
jgi:hypothetical protein